MSRKVLLVFAFFSLVCNPVNVFAKQDTASCHQQNKAVFTTALRKHLDAVINRDLETMAATLHPEGKMQMLLPGAEAFPNAESFLDYHRKWFEGETEWSIESTITDVKVGCEVGMAITEQLYREPDRNGKPYFNRLYVSYVLEKVDGKWYVILDHASSIEKSTDKTKQAAVVPVKMKTDLGDISLEIYLDKAPITAANFLKYVDNGYYNGGSFYRTVTHQNDNNEHAVNVIQGGLNAALSKSFKAPEPAIAHEGTSVTGLLHTDGAIAMGRGKPGSARSEFFINVGNNPALDEGGMRNPDKLGFAVFGKVVDGMDVVKKIHQSSANGAASDPYVKGQMLDKPVAILELGRE